jgi:hypothetical protein
MSELSALRDIAHEVGASVWEPEGGISTESSNEDILECIQDIASGSPHNMTITRLTELQVNAIFASFWQGVSDAAVR